MVRSKKGVPFKVIYPIEHFSRFFFIVQNRAKQLKGVDSKLACTILDQILDLKTDVRFADIVGKNNAPRILLHFADWLVSIIVLKH